MPEFGFPIASDLAIGPGFAKGTEAQIDFPGD